MSCECNAAATVKLLQDKITLLETVIEKLEKEVLELKEEKRKKKNKVTINLFLVVVCKVT